MQKFYIQELRSPFKELIRKKNLVGIEIGVSIGINAFSILSNLDIEKLYLIDPYIKRNEHLKKSIKNLSKFDNKIERIIDYSENAVNNIMEPLDFVYIDGNHKYKFVNKDIKLYYPLIKEGGLMSGHDYDVSGVRKAVNEIFGKENINIGEKDWWLFV